MRWTGAACCSSPRRALAIVTLGLALARPGARRRPCAGIYALAFIAAGLGAVDQPTRASAIPRLVPPERLQSAISLNQLVFNAGAVVGPAIGGIVVATFDVSVAYCIDALTYGAAITALLLIAPIPPAPGAVRPSIGAIVEGLRFARRRRPVLGTFIVDLVAMVFGSPRSLFPAMALDVFRVGPAGLGCSRPRSRSAPCSAAFFTGWTTRVRRPGRAVLVAVGRLGPRDRGVRAGHVQLPARAPVPGDRRGRRRRSARSCAATSSSR